MINKAKMGLTSGAGKSPKVKEGAARAGNGTAKYDDMHGMDEYNQVSTGPIKAAIVKTEE